MSQGQIGATSARRARRWSPPRSPNSPVGAAWLATKGTRPRTTSLAALACRLAAWSAPIALLGRRHHRCSPSPAACWQLRQRDLARRAGVALDETVGCRRVGGQGREPPGGGVAGDLGPAGAGGRRQQAPGGCSTARRGEYRRVMAASDTGARTKLHRLAGPGMGGGHADDAGARCSLLDLDHLATILASGVVLFSRTGRAWQRRACRLALAMADVDRRHLCLAGGGHCWPG